MEDHIGQVALGDRRQGLVAYVELVELHPAPGPGGRQVVGMAGRQVVDHEHLMGLIDQAIDQVTSDEPRSTGDQCRIECS